MASPVPKYDVSKTLKKLEEDINLFREKNTHGPLCTDLCKLAAKYCFSSYLEKDGIYYLSEAHGMALRHEYSMLCELNRIKNETKNDIGLYEKYILANEKAYITGKYEGLLSRLKDMPEEWTLIQITRPHESRGRWQLKSANSATEISDLQIVRYTCGSSSSACRIRIPPGESDHGGTQTILQLLYNSTMEKSLHIQQPSRVVKQKRIHNCEQLQSVVRDISSSWLQEWKCFLLGKLCDSKLEKLITTSIDKIISKSDCIVTSNDKRTIQQIANGSAYLSEEEIDTAISQLVRDFELENNLIDAINCFKKNTSFNNAKRYPVILILDEKLECVPWEMTSTLIKHPVCRMPSIHFTHALYKRHERNIKNGNIIIKMSDPAFYIVNPDKSLNATENRITDFLNERCPEFRGMVRKSPSKEEFIDALSNNKIFLYCGHGNGTQYCRKSDINDINVNAVSLLFGCSSVQYKDFGGRMNLISLAQNYLMSGSPCVLGMLWSVTNNDTDLMTLTVLNHWLPGNPITIQGFDFVKPGTMPSLSYSEPELLRVITTAREPAVLYTDKAAMVVYGLPVKIVP